MKLTLSSIRQFLKERGVIKEGTFYGQVLSPLPTAQYKTLRAKAANMFGEISHENWRATLPDHEKDQVRMRAKKGADGIAHESDINQSWSKLHPSAQHENFTAGIDAYDAVTNHPKDDNAAAAHIWTKWKERNPRNDYNAHMHDAPSWNDLTPALRNKDIAQVEIMKRIKKITG